MEILKSKNNPKIKHWHKLQDKKYRLQSKTFLIEGYHLVEEAIKHNLIVEIIESETNWKYKNSIKVSKDIIEHLSTTKTPQNILAECKFITREIKFNKILILNNLQDPGNIGTIIRLAKAFGFDSIAVENFDFYNPKVIRSSQGAFFDLNIFKISSSEEFIKQIKQKDFRVYATVLNQRAKKLNQTHFQQNKIAVVLGNEGNGISQQVQNICDEWVYVPIEFESLNVACCAAIILNKIYNES